MSNEVVIAIISGIGAVIAAVIAWFQSLRTVKLKVETELAIEKMKIDRERRQKAFEIACQESAPIEAAINRAWEDIQIIKEEISKILSEGEYHADLALGFIETASNRLREEYGKWAVSLPQDARDVWHKAKGNASAIQGIVVKHSPIKEANPELPPDIKEKLRDARTSLTDYQMILTSTRQSLRNLQIQRILEEI
jgi:hypothetical protein